MAEAFSIGRLAALTGLPVKTIRFYSDAGLLPPSGRTEAGHRRYTATDVARLQLVRTLRELGVDLGAIGQLLAGRRALGELLAAHVAALEARDRALHRQLAVLRVAAASPTEATLRRVHALARLEAAEHRRLLDRFWDRVTEGLPGDEAVDRLRALGTPELPPDPTGEQLDAWLELAELAADEDFQRTTRANAAGVEPSHPRAAAAVALVTRGLAAALGRRDGPAFRRWLAWQLDAHTDPRAERYWRLVGTIQGRPREEFAARVADHAWLMAALRHHAAAPRGTARAEPARGPA